MTITITFSLPSHFNIISPPSSCLPFPSSTSSSSSSFSSFSSSLPPPASLPFPYNSLSYSLSPSLLFLISHISTSSLLSSLPGTSDYVSTPVLITFHPESSLQVACSSISINNDFVLELQPETFTVHLSSPSPSIIITGQPSATISIWDDDSKEHQGFLV